jgi:hypothetical protein
MPRSGDTSAGSGRRNPMSDFRAIQGVSTTLKALIEDRCQNKIKVTIAPPDVSIDGIDGTRVNLFLYRVTENGSLKNQEIPGVGYPRDYGHPPLSLDLHYLLTVLGINDSDESTAQQILGDVMRVLHDYSVITDSLLKRQSEDRILDASLQGQFEKIKITQAPISLEDITKIWTSLTKPYRLSVAYNVNVVQIESRLERPIKRLVGEPPLKGPKVYAVPFTSPRIKEIRVIRKDDKSRTERWIPFASIGDTIVIIGFNFQGETPVRTILGPDGGNVAIKNLTDERIEVVIPDIIVDEKDVEHRLQPGPNTVEVVRDIKMGEPPVDHIGMRSNQAPFMLVPGIDKITPPNINAFRQTLKIEGSRLYNAKKESVTLIGSTRIETYSTREEKVLEFELPDGLEKGDQTVRVRVNGAENIDKYIKIT